MKYTKYTIVKDFGEYYIEVPCCWFFTRRLTYRKCRDIGYQTFCSREPYDFKTHREAEDFAEEHKYVSNALA